MDGLTTPVNKHKRAPNHGRRKCGGLLEERFSDIPSKMKRCVDCGAVKYTENTHCDNYVTKVKN